MKKKTKTKKHIFCFFFIFHIPTCLLSWRDASFKWGWWRCGGSGGGEGDGGGACRWWCVPFEELVPSIEGSTKVTWNVWCGNMSKIFKKKTQTENVENSNRNVWLIFWNLCVRRRPGFILFYHIEQTRNWPCRNTNGTWSYYKCKRNSS